MALDSVCVYRAALLSPCVACSIHDFLGLLLRSSGAVGGGIEPHAAQTFERPRLAHAHHVSTLCSALVDRVEQNGIRGPIFSMIIGLQRLSSMQPRGLGMA